jgi:hypothetical protein
MGPMERDEAIVARQIGRRPRGTVRVESRCAWGYPVVVAVEPMVPRRGGRGGREPFPTRFWLTCPILVEQIARLEASGLVDRLEEEVAGDPALAARVRGDAARHAAERFAALSPADRAAAEAAGALGILRDSGVGGVRDPRHLKCLHAQYAFHRARGSAIGEILDARHAPRECAEGEVRCDAFGIPPAT